LQPLTVLVGSNGGGKSALFDAMLNFSMLSRGKIQQAFGPYPFSYRSTIYRGSSNLSRIGFEILMSETQTSDIQLKYEIQYSQAENQSFTIFNERLTQIPDNTVLFDRSDVDRYPDFAQLRFEQDRSLFSAVRMRSISSESEPGFPLEYLTQQISRFNKFLLDPSTLAAPSRLPDLVTELATALPPRIGYRGEDLAATLYFLSETRHPSYPMICEKVRELVPEFSSFGFSAVGTDRIAFSIEYSDRRESVPSVRLSSGMLIYIGLIVLVLTPNRPPVLMIEEPENGLTPQAIKAFYKALRSLAFNEDSHQRSQVLISSHSPFVICEAWNGEDRNFIHQVKVKDSKALVRRFSSIVEEQGIQLAKDADGQRSILSLKNAEEIMSGYLST
jgi:predicted ATPase